MLHSIIKRIAAITITLTMASKSQNLPDDVRVVFEDLRNASLKHLDAFQKTRG